MGGALVAVGGRGCWCELWVQTMQLKAEAVVTVWSCEGDDNSAMFVGVFGPCGRARSPARHRTDAHRATLRLKVPGWAVGPQPAGTLVCLCRGQVRGNKVNGHRVVMFPSLHAWGKL